MTNEKVLYEESSRRMTLALSRSEFKTQQELADASGIKKASISQYVNGTHRPSNKTAGKLGKTLGVNPLWLMELSDDMYGFSKERAEFDSELLEKVSLLSERDKEIVMSLIEFMLSKKDGGAD